MARTPNQPGPATDHYHLGLGVERAVPEGTDPTAEITAAVAAHEAAGNPHATYETSAEAQAKVDAHAAAGNPHATYLTQAEGDAAYEPIGEAAAAVGTHSADTTSVHGVADTADLETEVGAQAKVDAAIDALDISAFIETLLPAVDAAAARATLGVDLSALPGAELDYVEKTTPTSVNATTEAEADIVVTSTANTYDGATAILIDFYAQYLEIVASTNARLYLYDGDLSIGILAVFTPSTSLNRMPVHVSRRLTPSAASHTYSIRAATDAGTASVNAGAGGSGNAMPASIRITRV